MDERNESEILDAPEGAQEEAALNEAAGDGGDAQAPEHCAPELEELRRRAASAEARALMARMGVPEASVQYVLRLMDAQTCANEEQVRQSVSRVLKDVPALMGAAGGGANPPAAEEDEFLAGFRM